MIALLLAWQLAGPADPLPVAKIHLDRIATLPAGSAQVRVAHRDLGLFWLRAGRPVDAEVHLRAALPDPTVIPFLGEAVAAQNRSLEAEAIFKECPKAARCVARLAEYAARRGDNDAAIGYYREASRLEPSGPRRNDLAQALQAAGQFKEAEAIFRAVALQQEKQLGPNHPETATTWNNLASLLSAADRYPEAEPIQRRALRTMERTLGPRHVRTGLSASNLADILRALGREAEARSFYRQALRIFQEGLPAGHPWIREAQDALRP